MFALSIRQPWAFAVASGVKRIENRTWSTNYRGPLIIHASKNVEWAVVDQVLAKVARLSHLPLSRVKRIYAPYAEGAAFIGEVQLAGVVRESDNPWFAGPIGWVVQDGHLFDPVPGTGALGIFGVTGAVRARVQASMQQTRQQL